MPAPWRAPWPAEGDIVPDSERSTGVSEACAVPAKRPHIFRRLYYWVLHWAYTPYAVPALISLAFAESSFFPVPPDVLLMAMAMGNRRKAFRYAAICTVSSVIGGLAGVGIGYFFWEFVGAKIIAFYHYEEQFGWVTKTLGANMNLYVFVAAFTPIPYKVFTIGAGVVAFSEKAEMLPFLLGFVVASTVGRGGRFFLVSTLLYFLGDWAKRFIDKYFEWLALAFGLLAVAGVLAIKYWNTVSVWLSRAAGAGGG